MISGLRDPASKPAHQPTDLLRRARRQEDDIQQACLHVHAE
jgi:hypothetical protein